MAVRIRNNDNSASVMDGEKEIFVSTVRLRAVMVANLINEYYEKGRREAAENAQPGVYDEGYQDGRRIGYREGYEDGLEKS